MTTHAETPVVTNAAPSPRHTRTARRIGAAAGAGAFLVAVTLIAAPALAEPAEGSSVASPVSGVAFLVVLVGLPALAALVITLLVLAPSIARGSDDSSHKNAWESGGLWFGGPRGGIEAADEKALGASRPAPGAAGSGTDSDTGSGPAPAPGVGGASGRW